MKWKKQMQVTSTRRNRYTWFCSCIVVSLATICEKQKYADSSIGRNRKRAARDPKLLTISYTPCSENVSTENSVMMYLSPSVKTCFMMPCLKKLHVSLARSWLTLDCGQKPKHLITYIIGITSTIHYELGLHPNITFMFHNVAHYHAFL